MNSRLALATGGLFLVAVTLAGCGGMSGSTSPTSPSPTPTPVVGVSADLTITITGMNGSNSFSPNPSSIVAGRTVAFRNADNVTHTATADSGTFDTGNIAPGATSAPITMAASGAFNYHCKIHPDMVGTLNVTAQ